jgi:hypothetical protein
MKKRMILVGYCVNWILGCGDLVAAIGISHCGNSVGCWLIVGYNLILACGNSDDDKIGSMTAKWIDDGGTRIAMDWLNDDGLVLRYDIG